MQTTPILKDLVLIGGGHAHVEVLRRFAMQPVTGTRITLVSEASTSPYSGMLPGHVAGHYDSEEIHIDLRRLAAVSGARFIRARVSGLDPDSRVLLFENRPSLAYNLLSINTGSVPNTGTTPGSAAFALPVKPIGAFLDRLSTTVGQNQARRVAVVGGGAAGIEISLALRRRFGGNPTFELALYEAGETIVAGINPRARRHILKALSEAGIMVHTGHTVDAINEEALVLADGRRVPSDLTIWATGASAPDWLAHTGLATTAEGFLRIGPDLRSVSHATILGAGDSAAIDGASLPRSGVYAVRQGSVLADNLHRVLKGERTRRYRPQSQFLRLIATGPKHAVASRGSFAAAGKWVWRWKDRIDRRFMDRYGTLSPMRPAQAGISVREPSDQGVDPAMRCKGCGAKLGPDVLSRALERLSTSGSAPDPAMLDDAAILTPPPGFSVLQSVDFFPALLSDPRLFGMIAANHCLGDIHAMGAKPWTALALAQVCAGAEEIQSEDLFHMLAGAATILEAEGARLIGGHSLEGDELGLGFTVNGLAKPDAIIGKAGLAPGDVLILTKPIGTGTLFAAEMRGRAKPRWIDDAIEMMTRGNGAAAQIFSANGATAMTDVTGFGLAGHLGEMLNASGMDAMLDTEAIPVLDGARELLNAGIESSLAPRNRRRVERTLADPERWPAHLVGLLSDPQTAGGLLAGVPADKAAECLAALNAAGSDARIVGHAVDRRSSTARIHLD